MTTQELQNIGIFQWADIKHEYRKVNLLLGNGFSMKISPTFSYNSLFAHFLTKCNSIHQTLFNQFGTTNFELILEYLSYAHKVNSIFNQNVKKIETAIETLKNGLIDAINDVHPRKSQINWSHIDRITDSLQDFNDVFTTNYDLFLYHIIMKSKDKYRINNSHRPYQDYFWGDYSTDYKEFKNFQQYTYYKHVYYLHGSLFIFNRDIVDLKIMLNNTNNELLDIITDKIKKYDFPIFVSEGTANDKIDAINRNNYLNFCLEQLQKSNKSFLVYGHSLSAVDSHIFNALTKKPKDIVISLYTNGKTDIQIKSDKYNFLSKFNGYPNKITFIDSNSIFS